MDNSDLPPPASPRSVLANLGPAGRKTGLVWSLIVGEGGGGGGSPTAISHIQTALSGVLSFSHMAQLPEATVQQANCNYAVLCSQT